MPISNEQLRIEVGNYFFKLEKAVGHKLDRTSFLEFLTLLLLSFLLWPILSLIIVPMVLLYSFVSNLRESEF